MDLNGSAEHASTAVNSTGTGCNTAYTTTNYCAHRLPCGYCMIMNRMCINPNGNWQPSWTITTASNTSDV